MMAAADIADRINQTWERERSKAPKQVVLVSYMQVYNEAVQDLLSSSPNRREHVGLACMHSAEQDVL